MHHKKAHEHLKKVRKALGSGGYKRVGGKHVFDFIMNNTVIISLLLCISLHINAQDSLKYFLDKKENMCDKKGSTYEVNLFRQDTNDSIVYYKSVLIKTKKTFEEGTYKCIIPLDNLKDFEKFKANRQALKHGDYTKCYENGNSKYKGSYIEGIVDKTKPFNEWTEDGEAIYANVDVMPVFPNGTEGLKNFIQSNVVYPPEALEKNIQEKIYVKFMINKRGKVKNISTTKGQSQILIDAAIKVVKKMPKWKPGEHGGKKVNVWFQLPIYYELTS